MTGPLDDEEEDAEEEKEEETGPGAGAGKEEEAEDEEEAEEEEAAAPAVRVRRAGKEVVGPTGGGRALKCPITTSESGNFIAIILALSSEILVETERSHHS